MPQVMGYQDEDNTVTRVLHSASPNDLSFEHKEPGFSLTVDSLSSLSNDDKSKIFGQIGALLSVAAFDLQNDSIEIQGPTREDIFPTTDS